MNFLMGELADMVIRTNRRKNMAMAVKAAPECKAKSALLEGNPAKTEP